MNKKILVALLSFGFIGVSSNSFAKSKTFTLDTDHSSVEFKIRHLVGKVKGTFAATEGKIEFDADKADKFKVSGKLDAASVNTGIQKRDDHLKSPDFFDVNNTNTQFKSIAFESSKFTNVVTTADETKGQLEGKITIHGVTKPITLDVTIHGKPMLDPWGNERMAVSATGRLNRKDFGLTWNKAVETGGFVVGDDVDLELEVEAIAKPDAKKK